MRVEEVNAGPQRTSRGELLRAGLDAAKIGGALVFATRKSDELFAASLDAAVQQPEVRKALKAYGNELPTGREIPVFQGAGHDSTREYLIDPVKRDIKSAFYEPFVLTVENNVRRYHFDGKHWKLVDQIPF